MSKLKYTFILGAVMLAVVVSQGCGEDVGDVGSFGDPTASQTGRIEGSSYVNDRFGFTLTLPDGWNAADDEQLKMIAEMSGMVVPNDDARRAMEEALKEGGMILFASEHEFGAPVEFNSSINITTESLAGVSGVNTPEDYIFHAKRMLDSTGMDIKMTDGDPLTVGPVTMGTINASTTVMDITFSQIIYVALLGDYAVTFTCSYGDEASGKKLKTAMESIQFGS